MTQKLLLALLILTILIGCKPKYSEQTKTSSPKIEVTYPENGTLFIIGGGSGNSIYTKFMELVGGADARIVVIPTANTSDTITEMDKERFKNRFVHKGFTNVTVLHSRNRDETNSEAFIKPIKNAAGVWFSEGRQWRHADSYLNTKTHEAFNELLKRGGVIAGSSAGATIQGSYLARGDTATNTIMMGSHQEGLGFIGNVAIDQHLLARNRQFDMFEILSERHDLLGIGLDENTGIIVKDGKFEVFGESYVAIYDGTRWSEERDTIYQLPPDSKEFYLLKEGDKYDLKKLRVILEQ